MGRMPVSSSRINSVGWENDTLEVEFKNGAIYQYYDFIESEYRMFLNAPSLGHEISRIDKSHRYRRIN